MKRIEFETAKLAKEVGYRINTALSYWFGEKGNTDVKGRTNETPWYEFPEDEEKYLSYPRYFAPYQAELQEWLRDIHGIHVNVDSLILDKVKWDYHICKIEEDTILGLTKSSSAVDTYEEALEEGLQEALKLIKK